MSVSYLLVPVDEQILAYGKDSGVVDLPPAVSAGRFPTVDELIAVLEATPGHRVSRVHRSNTIDVTIESFARIPFEPGPPFKQTTTPASYLYVTGDLSGTSKRKWLSFHGDLDVTIPVIQRLTAFCGPLVFFADCDGVPWFVLSEQSPPLGREPWITRSG